MKNKTTTLARTLRRQSTPTEAILWFAIKGCQINSFKFRRQQPIGPYIADFYCPEIKLVIEVDGDVHAYDENIISDRKREEYLRNLGLNIFRITNNDVRNNLSGVLEQLFTLTLTLSHRGRGNNGGDRDKIFNFYRMTKMNKMTETKIKPKATIFIDGANMFFAQKKSGWQIDWQKVKIYFESHYRIQELRYYSGVKKDDDKMKKYLRKLKSYGFTIITKSLKKIKLNVVEDEKHKKSEIFIYKANFDAEIAFDLARIDSQTRSVVLCSGDSDFVYPLEMLKKENKEVVVFSSKRSIAWELRHIKVKLILIEDYQNEFSR